MTAAISNRAVCVFIYVISSCFLVADISQPVASTSQLSPFDGVSLTLPQRLAYAGSNITETGEFKRYATASGDPNDALVMAARSVEPAEPISQILAGMVAKLEATGVKIDQKVLLMDPELRLWARITCKPKMNGKDYDLVTHATFANGALFFFQTLCSMVAPDAQKREISKILGSINLRESAFVIDENDLKVAPKDLVQWFNDNVIYARVMDDGSMRLWGTYPLNISVKPVKSPMFNVLRLTVDFKSESKQGAPISLSKYCDIADQEHVPPTSRCSSSGNNVRFVFSLPFFRELRRMDVTSFVLTTEAFLAYEIQRFEENGHKLQ